MRSSISIIIAILGVILVSAGGFFFFFSRKEALTVSDYKNIAYVINGQRITLIDGVSEIPAVTDSATKIVTRYFGNSVEGDFNGDGLTDIAFLLTQTTGGSGTFYYVVAALKNASGGYEGSEAVLLGDRIAPQTTEISRQAGHVGVIVVNYADRQAGEPMTARPSVGKSIWLKLDPKTMQFGEVVQNFEGEADPMRMTLPMKTWVWISALYGDGTNVAPKKEGVFTLAFKNDGTFSATTDCNGVGGEYATKNNTITFTRMISTLMYCEGSQEAVFAKMLNEAQGYHFTSKGELILDLKLDSGSAIFR